MALSRARRSERRLDYWPGFVDALSTLVLSIIFILTVFVLGQFFLSQEISGRDTALQRLNRQILELNELLALERANRQDAEDNLAALQSTLQTAEADRQRLQGLLSSGSATSTAANARIGQLTAEIDKEKAISARAMSQVELLNQQLAALRRQLAALEDALAASEARDKDSQARVADLGSRLNVALAQRVQELARFRSDFFGRLRQILGERPDIRVVGDRFVFQSEVFFDAGSAALLPAGAAELDKVASALIDLDKEIPADIPWIIRVDGHTDKRPLSGLGEFKSNWALSAARAIAVVQYFVMKGVPPQRLLAAGFGEYQPIELGDSEEAYRRNRRIELKLTER
ncbi:peptidoglycan -binding protein [Chelatococcus asaccharovorans]|uniref:Chemotaxis protein MotB n=1 Tax=Chelatococcus asaccharovorans TaxID=28210 RepID=A0A2V3U943_9HYPH|nr:peptidoglycan -binding protein [Chelatococcus asaccharovorans]MBS7705280.1 peptidoglycan -binding protein [Chelatococcus asaccharovorans]PXW60317.1 chemotaxis protein MotB [Chelatococcus asaccharovorans]